MFDNKKLFTRAALVLASLLGACAANAQRGTCLYSVANIQGSYADVVTFGSGQASGLLTVQFDGNGAGTATGTVNEPTPGSTTGARTIVAVSATLTYTVNCDGTGQITVTVTLPGGGTQQVLEDFVITKAVSSNGVLVATTIQAAEEEASFIVPGGVFVTDLYTLQIDPVVTPVQQPEKLHRQPERPAND
jgi:hypothetical protein